jgi:hypothetical protein
MSPGAQIPCNMRGELAMIIVAAAMAIAGATARATGVPCKEDISVGITLAPLVQGPG